MAPFVARQNYVRIAQINIAAACMTAVFIFAFIPLLPTAATYLGCLTAGFATSLIVAFVVATTRLAGWLSLPRMHRHTLRALLHFGSWQAAALGGGLIAGQADRYLLGANLGPERVGYYNIAQRLQEVLYIGVLKIGEVLFPLFASLHGEKPERQADILFRASWILNLVAVSVLGPVIPLAGDILHLWTGADVARQSERVLVVLASAGIIGSATNVFSFYLLGSGKTFFNAVISLSTDVVTLCTSVIALPILGWRAAGWSTLAGMGVQLVVMVLLVGQSFRLRDGWARIIHFILSPLLVGTLCAWLLRTATLLAPDTLQALSWWKLILLYGLFAMLIALAVFIAARLGPYGATCEADLRRIVERFTFRRER